MALDFPNTPSLNQTFTGPNGTIWMWDGVKWVAITSTSTYAGAGNVGRNLLHNPLFQVAQRGTGPWTTATYTLDRWSQYLNLDTLSTQQANLTDTDRTQLGDEAAKVCIASSFTGNAGAAAQSILSQGIEDVRRLAGKTVTVSFWAKYTSGTPKLGVCIGQNFGYGGAPSAAVYTPGTPVTLSAAWQRFSMALALPSAAGKTFGTTGGTDQTLLIFAYSSGATNNAIYGGIGVQTGAVGIWGVQLEIGSVATPLEKPDPRYDLANCQRFYQTADFYGAQYNVAGNGNYINIYLSTAMRATPTVTVGSGAVTNASGQAVGAFGGKTNNVLLAQFTTITTGQTFFNGTAVASADL